MKKLYLTEENKKNVLDELIKRSPNHYGDFEAKVAEIVNNVRENGDAAIFEYTKNFDKFDLNKDNILVTKEEIEEAYNSMDPVYIKVMEEAYANIVKFHEKQVRNSFFTTDENGSILGQRITPIDKVGVYVPGGKAAYPSSTLMNIGPAKCAGCKNIYMITPPNAEGKVNPGTLAAAKIAGVDRIYKVGGAQAIAAFAFGTESIPKVDKIVGPGNIFVALAKKAVYGYVSIDSVAGPSEILVLADETAKPEYVARDLLSQAEHDEMASCILVTTSEELANKVESLVAKYVAVAKRKSILEKSVENFGFILIAKDMDSAFDAVNDIASEHLEIVTKNPWADMTKVSNAGAIFLGEYSSEPLGDYFAGPNHVLPTNGTSRFFSPLSVDDFIKKSSVICYSEEGLRRIHEKIEIFAENEGLEAHANSIRERFGKNTL